MKIAEPVEPRGENLPLNIQRATVRKKNYIYHPQFTDEETEVTSLVQGHLPIRGDGSSLPLICFTTAPLRTEWNRLMMKNDKASQVPPLSGGRTLGYSGCFKGQMLNQAPGLGLGE